MNMRNDELDAGSAASNPRVGATKGTVLAPSLSLRSTLGRTRASRLVFPTGFATALLLGATLTLSACGAVQEASAAATVNGTVISDQDVQTIPAQLNTLAQDGQEKLTPSNALLSLILAPYVLDEAKRAGKTVSPADARKVVAKLANPAPSTLRFLEMQIALSQLDEASKASIVKELGKAKITVNPRYGTFDATQVALTPSSPNWIKPSASPPAK